MNENDFLDSIDKKEKIFQISTYFCLALSLVSTITYMIVAILNSSNLVNQIFSIISVIILAIFSVLYVILGMFAEKKKVKIFIIIGSLLLSFYSLFQITSLLSSKDLVPDFMNKDIKEVVSWAEERDILVEQEFIFSDTISKYKVISQDVKAGTKVKKVKKIKVTVSDGIDETVETEVTSMVGWDLDDVIAYIDENHLTNVKILFEFSNTTEKDKIISQDVVAEIKRNEPITLVSSLGKESEQTSVTMDNLIGMDTFHAIIYLERNRLNYSIEYNYNEDVEEDIVFKQSIKKWTVISPTDNTEVIITVAKKDEITVPNFMKMSATEINTWATNNRLKVEFEEVYDDSVSKGKVLSSNYVIGSLIKVGDTINLKLSKGPIYMIKFTNATDFTTWAEENDIAYTIDYQYSSTVPENNLISSSHKENQIIKNSDTVKLVISQGGNTIVPNLVGMNKEEATSSCKKANLTCKFIYLNDNEDYTVVTKQSMRSGSNVPTNTTVTITLGK